MPGLPLPTADHPSTRTPTLDTAGVRSDCSITTVGNQIGAVAATKAVTADAGGGQRKWRIQSPRQRQNCQRHHYGQRCRRPRRACSSERRLRIIVACDMRPWRPRCSISAGGRSDSTRQREAKLTSDVPACQTTVVVEEADRRALRQHIDKALVGAMTIARRAVPAEGGGGGASTRATRDRGGGGR